MLKKLTSTKSLKRTVIEKNSHFNYFTRWFLLLFQCFSNNFLHIDCGV